MILRDGGGNVTGYELDRPDGSRTLFTHNDPSFDANTWFLSRKEESTGLGLDFGYALVGNTGSLTGQILLRWVTNAVGEITTLNYADPTYTNSVSSVVDPAGNTVTFTYANTLAKPHTASITDTVGIYTTFTYTADDWPDQMQTPYGTTSFQYYDWGTPGTADLNEERYLIVTEPAGGKHIYDLVGLSTSVALLPTTFSSSVIPTNTPLNTLDTTDRQKRGSFHWGPAQVGTLSSSYPSNFVQADFLKGRWSRWLFDSGGFGQPLQALSTVQDPSPDGTTQGQVTFYDYTGKPASDSTGPEEHPAVIARVQPDGSTWYMYYQYNAGGNLTNSIEKWVDSGTTRYRTNRYVYDTTGVDLVYHVRPDGVTSEGYAYDAVNHPHLPIRMTNALSEITSYAYLNDGTQRPDTQQSAAGLLNTYSYDATSKRLLKDVASISGTPLRTNSLTWLNGRVRTTTDPRGLTLTYSYDALGRLTTVTHPDSTSETYGYGVLPGQSFSGSSGGSMLLDLTSVTNRLGGVRLLVRDGLRRVALRVDERNVTNAYGFCDCGALTSVTNAYGKAEQEITGFTYDAQGKQLTKTFPDGSKLTNTYDLPGRKIIIADALGSTTNGFDNLNRLYSVSNAYGQQSQVLLDVVDRGYSLTDRNGVTVTNTYDNLDRLRTHRTLGDNGVEEFGYTANYGAATSYTNQMTNVTTWAYDVAQRKTNEVVVGLMTNSFAYNGANDLLELYDGKQAGTTNRTRWTYDTYGRVSLKQYANGVTNLTYAYDELSRLTNRWSQSKGNTKYRYDQTSNLTNVDYPSSTDLKYQYNALSRVTNMVDAVGTTVYAYSGGLLTSEDGPWASDTVSYGYNGARLRSQLVVIQPTGNAWTNSYTYDAAKRLAYVASPAGSFTNTYVTSLNGVTGPSGLLIKRGFPGGSYLTNLYDANGRLTDTSLMTNGVVLNRHGYLYDLANERNWMGRTNAANSSWVGYHTNTFDVASELRTVRAYDGSGTSVPTLNFDYGYDPAWNIAKRTNNATVTSYTLNNLNQVTSDGSSFTYDNNGNRLTGTSSPGTATYEYDDENQLTAVYVPTYWKEAYSYDGRQRLRVRQSYTWDASHSSWSLAAETRYVYDGLNLLQERTSSNNPAVTYTRGTDLSGTQEGAGGIGGLLARSEHATSGTYQAASSAFYHADGNGNVTAMVDSTPALVASYRYNPYGNLLASSGSKAANNAMRFSSKPAWTSASGHSTGLSYYGYRFYDSLAGRWINRDPILEAGGINIYGFVWNGPIDGVDFWGLEPENPFHGFDPEKLRKLFKDPDQCNKGRDLLKSFKDSIDHAKNKLKDPNTTNPDRYRRFMDEMQRRIKNINDVLPAEPPWYQRIPLPMPPIFINPITLPRWLNPGEPVWA